MFDAGLGAGGDLIDHDRAMAMPSWGDDPGRHREDQADAPEGADPAVMTRTTKGGRRGCR